MMKMIIEHGGKSKLKHDQINGRNKAITKVAVKWRYEQGNEQLR